MSREVFREAIAAFRNSQTYQGRAPIPGEPPLTATFQELAPRVARKLDQLVAAGEIDFHRFPSEHGTTSSADSEAGREAADIRIHEGLQSNHAAISVLLVHEACHLVLRRRDLDEEITCHTLAVLYYREMVERGVSFDLLADDGYIYRNSFRMDRDDPAADLKKQLEKFRLNQLIDYILHYPAYRRLLTPQWVHRGLSWWRGPSNRWYHTRGYYVRALTESPSFANALDVVTLLKSVPHGQRDNWDILWRAFATDGGRADGFHITLATLLGDHVQSDQIRALKTTWGDPLCPLPSLRGRPR